MNGILLVDKPQEWTSSDVVAKLRGVLREKRIGHAGTLDPMATGLLVVLVGHCTKASEYAMAHNKEYVAGLRLGVSTDTQDITGTVIKTGRCRFSPEDLERVLKNFTGDLQQIPPMYSAIKLKGEKLYSIARRGEEVDRKPRSITVSSIELIGGPHVHSAAEAEAAGDPSAFPQNFPEYDLKISCSPGTYIRTLCHDIGEELGCGGCMSSLRRTRIGAYSVEEAYTLQQIIEAAKEGRAEEMILPVDTVFSEYPEITVEGRSEQRLKNGIPVKAELDDGFYRVYSGDHEFMMLGKSENRELKSVKNFFG